MNAGSMDRRIRLEEAEPAVSTSGTPVLLWPPEGGHLVREMWAKRMEQRATERFTSDQVVAEQQTGWRVRWFEIPDGAFSAHETFRVIEDGKVYDVTGVVEVGRREGLDIFGRARAEAA